MHEVCSARASTFRQLDLSLVRRLFRNTVASLRSDNIAAARRKQ